MRVTSILESGKWNLSDWRTEGSERIIGKVREQDA